jgi:hypothetical protein
MVNAIYVYGKWFFPRSFAKFYRYSRFIICNGVSIKVNNSMCVMKGSIERGEVLIPMCVWYN